MQPHELLRSRLRAELDSRKMSAVELARVSGVKSSFIYDILNGKSANPSTVKLALVAETLQISLSYLAGATDSPRDSAQADGDAVAIAPLNPGKGKKAKENGFLLSRQWLKDTLKLDSGRLRLLTVKGDGMAPTFQNGDLLLVDTDSVHPSPGGIFVISDGHGPTIRRLEFAGSARNATIRVLSDNPRYGAYESPAKSLEVLGRVVWFSRTL